LIFAAELVRWRTTHAVSLAATNSLLALLTLALGEERFA
jgi:hypothetical protein